MHKLLFFMSCILMFVFVVHPVVAQETAETTTDADIAAEDMAMTFPPGDAELGAKVFKKCMACHKVGEKAKNGVGPMLNNVVGNAFGTVEGYKYSKSLLGLAEEGAVWDFETLDTYLTKPRSVIPKTKMAFAGLKKPEDRLNVIEYLRQFSPLATEEEGAEVEGEEAEAPTE